MASLNTTRKSKLPPQGGIAPYGFEPSNTLRTHEGGAAATISPEQALRRAVCSCLLWENEFYESGQDVAARIVELAARVPPKILADLAVDARSHFNLRHVPLLLCAVLARTGAGSRLVGDTLAATIQRADELGEFLAIYAKVNGVAPSAVKKKLSAQIKRGLALAFGKFDAYALGKYATRTDAVVRGRDALFLAHPRPKDEEQAALWKRLADKEPIEVGGVDTWEVALSAGADKKETFERLLTDGKLGYLALLRNLRNMEQARVDPTLVHNAIIARRGARRVFPFRYVAAARAAPTMTDALDTALSEAISELPILPGRTAVLVDVSGSMAVRLSDRSDLTRMDAAAALAMLIHGDVRTFSFSNHIREISGERGLRGIEVIIGSQPHGSTELGMAVMTIDQMGFDRMIVITDEQSHTHVAEPNTPRAYLINVASAKNGVGYGERWTHLDGFSEQVIRWIHEFERLDG